MTAGLWFPLPVFKHRVTTEVNVSRHSEVLQATNVKDANFIVYSRPVLMRPFARFIKLLIGL